LGLMILTNKGLVLLARREGLVARFVAKVKLGRLGHRVLVSAPNEFDRVANRCVDGERHISKNTLSRSDPDGVRRTAPVATRASSHGGRHVHGRWRAELSHTFYRQSGLAMLKQAWEEAYVVRSCRSLRCSSSLNQSHTS